MLTIEGVYHNGTIDLSEPPPVEGDVTVLVTFLTLKPGQTSDETDPHQRDTSQAADLRRRLRTFTEEWDSPEMEVYDHYDAVKSTL